LSATLPHRAVRLAPSLGPRPVYSRLSVAIMEAASPRMKFSCEPLFFRLLC
jgi:hypothetical protein